MKKYSYRAPFEASGRLPYTRTTALVGGTKGLRKIGLLHEDMTSRPHLKPPAGRPCGHHNMRTCTVHKHASPVSATGPVPRAPRSVEAKSTASGTAEGAACTRSTVGRASRVSGPHGACHWQIGVRARSGVIDACGSVTEAGDDARTAGTAGAPRVHTCSRGWRRSRVLAEAPPFYLVPSRNICDL